MSENDPEKQRRVWHIDPGIFRPGPKTKITERITAPLKSFGRIALLVSFLSYPVVLAILGIAYGGLVFWGAFGGSMIVIWLVLTKTGYARNFEAWGPSLGRKLAALTLAFIGVMGFFIGLTRIGIWTLPPFFGVLALVVVYMLRK